MTRVTRHLASTPDSIATMLAEPSDGDVLDDRVRSALIRRLHALRHGTPRPPVRLDAFLVEHPLSTFATPFQWSARTARRTLGSRAARLVVTGAERSALAAARHEIERQRDRALRGLTRSGALGAWLAAASDVVRAECAIEAATWATTLLTLVAPDHTGVAVGIPDAWFEIPRAATTLRARRDAVSGTGTVGGGVLRVRDGSPGPRAVDGLIVDGLIVALASEVHRAPSLVLGAWPDAGLVLAVSLDPAAARRGARLLATSARATSTPAASRRAPIAA